jgi:hypothetical protein
MRTGFSWLKIESSRDFLWTQYDNEHCSFIKGSESIGRLSDTQSLKKCSIPRSRTLDSWMEAERPQRSCQPARQFCSYNRKSEDNFLISLFIYWKGYVFSSLLILGLFCDVIKCWRYVRSNEIEQDDGGDPSEMIWEEVDVTFFKTDWSDICLEVVRETRSRGSSVGIATGYGLDDQGRREFESR